MGDNTEAKRQIFKASGIVGISQVIRIVVSIVRVKVAAIFLGPAGVGVLGIFTSAINFIRTVFVLGLNLSAVKEIANTDNLFTSIFSIKKLFLLLSIIGSLFTLIFAKHLSRLSFGDETYFFGFQLISIAIFFEVLFVGNIAILQGLRDMVKMSKANVIGIFFGSLFAIPLYVYFGLSGIVPSLILIALFSFAFSSYYENKVKVDKEAIALKSCLMRSKQMLRLGFSPLITGLTLTGSMYLVRVFISKEEGLDSVGLLNASWTLSSLYIATVLGAMCADFFPKLSAIQDDKKEFNSVLNDQIESVLLIGSPIIIGMICFSDIVINIFYSSEFISANEILQWQLLGAFIQLFYWPLSYVFLARGKGVLYIVIELFWNILFLVIAYFLWAKFKLEGVGIAYALSFLISFVVLFLLVYRISHCKPSLKLLKYTFIFGILVIISSVCVRLDHPFYHYIFGSIIVLLSVVFSYRELSKIINFKQFFSKRIK